MQYLSTQDTGNVSQILYQESSKKYNAASVATAVSTKTIPIITSPSISVVAESDQPLCDDLYISTKTKVLFLNQTIDIYNIFWDIPIIEYWRPMAGVVKKQMKIVSKTPEEFDQYTQKLATIPYYTENVIKQINNPTARRIKFKDERKITVGISKKDIMNCRGKVKNAFYNCFALIMRIPFDGQFKEIHVKVFNTGKLEIPGILTAGLLTQIKQFIVAVMQPHMSTPLDFLENASVDGVLINSNFNCGFYVNREKLHSTLRSKKYGIETAYDPCSYPGVKCKFYFNNEVGFDVEKQTGRIDTGDQSMKMSQLVDNKKYTEVSFMIFRTGSCLIVGNCSEEVLRFIYQFIRKILHDEYAQLCVVNDDQIKKEKKAKMRKKTIMVSADYYAQITV